MNNKTLKEWKKDIEHKHVEVLRKTINILMEIVLELAIRKEEADNMKTLKDGFRPTCIIFDELHEYKLNDGSDRRWNVNSENMEDIWKPSCDEVYYYMSTAGIKIFINISRWNDDFEDKACWNQGNCFKTYEEAEEKLKQILKDSFNPRSVSRSLSRVIRHMNNIDKELK